MFRGLGLQGFRVLGLRALVFRALMDFASSRLTFTRGPTVCLKGTMCAGVCQNRGPENTRRLREYFLEWLAFREDCHMGLHAILVEGSNP